MTRTLKYALTVVLGAMIVAPAMADQFPDVPESHWAYKELEQLKTDGLLVGYPDGLFRGGRPASRYEMAVAIYATYNALKTQNAALKTQMEDLERRMAGFATKEDIAALTSRIDALERELARLKSEDIDRLNKLTAFLSDELKKLGADVDAMKRDIRDLTGRVVDLENARFPFDVSGDLNIVALGGYGDNDRAGITVDGRPTGVGRGSYAGGIVGPTRDLTIVHEAALRVVSNKKFDEANKVRFAGTFVAGNMFDDTGRAGTTGTTWGNQSQVFPGSPFVEADTHLYVQELEIGFDTAFLGLAFNANVGRVGYKISPYIMQRLDATPYFANERWDDGRYHFDGAVLGFNFGKAKLDVFGGRMTNVMTNQGTQINPMIAGQSGTPFTPGGTRPVGTNYGLFNVDQFLGAKLSVPLTSTGALNLAYLWLDSNTIAALPSGGANGVRVMGGDVRFDFAGLGVEGGYSKSDVVYNNRSRVDEDNAAWYLKATYNRDRWGLMGGYRSIDPQFAAPGDWGRLGIWWNPTDIEGFFADFHFDINDNLRFRATGDFYRGTDTTIGGVTGLSNDDKITSWKIGFEYKLATNYNLALGYEEVRWDLADRVGFTGGEPRERWYNIGFGFDLTSKAKLSFLWQISDADSKGVVGFAPFGGGDTRAKGGLITTQLSIKY
jgi:hypothetical protein